MYLPHICIITTLNLAVALSVLVKLGQHRETQHNITLTSDLCYPAESYSAVRGDLRQRDTHQRRILWIRHYHSQHSVYITFKFHQLHCGCFCSHLQTYRASPSNDFHSVFNRRGTSTHTDKHLCDKLNSQTAISKLVDTFIIPSMHSIVMCLHDSYVRSWLKDLSFYLSRFWLFFVTPLLLAPSHPTDSLWQKAHLSSCP
jgi:hypothetical protein